MVKVLCWRFDLPCLADVSAWECARLCVSVEAEAVEDTSSSGSPSLPRARDFQFLAFVFTSDGAYSQSIRWLLRTSSFPVITATRARAIQLMVK